MCFLFKITWQLATSRWEWRDLPTVWKRAPGKPWKRTRKTLWKRIPQVPWKRTQRELWMQATWKNWASLAWRTRSRRQLRSIQRRRTKRRLWLPPWPQGRSPMPGTSIRYLWQSWLCQECLGTHRTPRCWGILARSPFLTHSGPPAPQRSTFSRPPALPTTSLSFSRRKFCWTLWSHWQTQPCSFS